MWTGRPSRLRAWIVGFSFLAWLLNFLAPLVHLPTDPGLGVAFFGVMGAALAMPLLDHERDAGARRRKTGNDLERERRKRHHYDGDADEADDG